MYVRCITLPFLLCLPAPLQSCRKTPSLSYNYKFNVVRENPPPSYDEEYEKQVKQAKKHYKKDANHYNTSWFPSNINSQNWQSWGETYKKTFDEIVNSDSTADLKTPNHTAMPSWWDNVSGPGYSGIDDSIPPWAQEPQNVGRPQECYEAHHNSACTPIPSLSGTRYYYDPFVNACKAFSYPGCGDSPNNFLSETICKSACADFDPTNQCAIESGVEFYDDRYYQDLVYP